MYCTVNTNSVGLERVDLAELEAITQRAVEGWHRQSSQVPWSRAGIAQRTEMTDRTVQAPGWETKSCMGELETR